jgi:YVTN family beta-propeller protein
VRSQRAGAHRFGPSATTVTAYVANNGGQTVTPIHTSTNTAGKAIKVGSSPIDIAIMP